MTFTLPDDTTPWFQFREDFPRPDWETIQTWIDEHAEKSQQDEAWQAVVRLWLDQVRQTLGSQYWISESDSFQLLSRTDQDFTDGLLELLESTRQDVRELLGPLAISDQAGKLPVIVLERREDYCAYIADFLAPQGEFHLTSGCFLFNGYEQIILQSLPLEELCYGVALDLTEASLMHLALPRWLLSGLTSAVAEEFSRLRRRDPLVILSEFRSTLAKEGLRNFWSGKWFYAHGDAGRFSHILAEILVRRLSGDRQKFDQFVLHADRNDAGAAAAKEYLGLDLAKVVEEFFGKGDWTPVGES